jgi:hypothetical protein
MGAATQAAAVIARNNVEQKEYGCHLADSRSVPNYSALESSTLEEIRKPA